MTAASGVPVHPRLGARLAYRMQRVLQPHAGFRWLSARIEASGPARTLFTGAEREVKAGLFGCRTCEVYPERRCVWVDAYERAADQGRSADLRLLHRPIDHRRWGQSSWLNYWQGRDEGLWISEADGTGADPVAGPGADPAGDPKDPGARL